MQAFSHAGNSMSFLIVRLSFLSCAPHTRSMSLDPRTIAREPRDRRVTAHDLRAGSDRYSREHRASPHRPLARRLTAGGTTGNERLTTATGVVLLVLLAVIGVTILRLRSLLWVHLFVGMLLIGPIALKMASTGYRFVRYYTANPRYRRKGPPPAPAADARPARRALDGRGVRQRRRAAVGRALLARDAAADPQDQLRRVGRRSPQCTCSGICPRWQPRSGSAQRRHPRRRAGRNGLDRWRRSLGLGGPGRRTHRPRGARRTRTLTCWGAGGRHGARGRCYPSVRPVASRLELVPPSLSPDRCARTHIPETPPCAGLIASIAG